MNAMCQDDQQEEEDEEEEEEGEPSIPEEFMFEAEGVALEDDMMKVPKCIKPYTGIRFFS